MTRDLGHPTVSLLSARPPNSGIRRNKKAPTSSVCAVRATCLLALGRRSRSCGAPHAGVFRCGGVACVLPRRPLRRLSLVQQPPPRWHCVVRRSSLVRRHATPISAFRCWLLRSHTPFVAFRVVVGLGSPPPLRLGMLAFSLAARRPLSSASFFAHSARTAWAGTKTCPHIGFLCTAASG